MGDSASSPVFAPECEGKSRQFASNLGAKYVWKTTTANNMRGDRGKGQLLLNIGIVWCEKRAAGVRMGRVPQIVEQQQFSLFFCSSPIQLDISEG